LSALVLTYHAVEPGPAPLCLEPAVFREHVGVLAGSGAAVLTVSELASALRAGELPERAVCLTFDDGFASVARHAAPVLAERGLRATVFCVAAHLDGLNDWPTQPRSTPTLRLASSTALAELAASGWEIGAHGLVHEPLDRASLEVAELEVVEARELLERTVGARVRSLALPYNAEPGAAVRQLIGRTYEAVCGGGLRLAGPGDDPLAIPRVDAYYVRRTDLLRRAVAGRLRLYLAARRLGAHARRLVRPGP
jgi:peptidoglycan/xylan/chitin deacetylase (PgdA/CDA1 family)